MTYEDFEKAVYDIIADEWDPAEATLIGEFYAKPSTLGKSLEISIGTEAEVDAELGSVGSSSQKMSILSGTVNMTFSLPSDTGGTETWRLTKLARAILHNRNIEGYGQFSATIKKYLGSVDGKLIYLILCPFTIEICE